MTGCGFSDGQGDVGRGLSCRVDRGGILELPIDVDEAGRSAAVANRHKVQADRGQRLCAACAGVARVGQKGGVGRRALWLAPDGAGRGWRRGRAAATMLCIQRCSRGQLACDRANQVWVSTLSVCSCAVGLCTLAMLVCTVTRTACGGLQGASDWRPIQEVDHSCLHESSIVRSQSALAASCCRKSNITAAVSISDKCFEHPPPAAATRRHVSNKPINLMASTHCSFIVTCSVAQQVRHVCNLSRAAKRQLIDDLGRSVIPE